MMMELGKNVAKQRKRKNIKSQELANQVGIGQPYISEIETGKKIPSIDVLQKIAMALDTTTSELLGEIQPCLNENMLRLTDAANGLSDEQVNALIDLIKAFTYTSESTLGNYRVAEEE